MIKKNALEIPITYEVEYVGIGKEKVKSKDLKFELGVTSIKIASWREKGKFWSRYGRIRTHNTIKAVDLSNLTNYTGLQEIEVHCEEMDLTHLSSCQELQKVKIVWSSEVKDFDLMWASPVFLPNLQQLDFSGNKISQVDFSPLIDCRLQHLDFSRNKISNVNFSPLVDCRTIKSISFRYNNLTLVNLSGLKPETSLFEVALGGNSRLKHVIFPRIKGEKVGKIQLGITGCSSIKILDLRPIQECELEFSHSEEGKSPSLVLLCYEDIPLLGEYRTNVRTRNEDYGWSPGFDITRPYINEEQRGDLKDYPNIVTVKSPLIKKQEKEKLITITNLLEKLNVETNKIEKNHRMKVFMGLTHVKYLQSDLSQVKTLIDSIDTMLIKSTMYIDPELDDLLNRYLSNYQMKKYLTDEEKREEIHYGKGVVIREDRMIKKKAEKLMSIRHDLQHKIGSFVYIERYKVFTIEEAKEAEYQEYIWNLKILLRQKNLWPLSDISDLLSIPYSKNYDLIRLGMQRGDLEGEFVESDSHQPLISEQTIEQADDKFLSGKLSADEYAKLSDLFDIQEKSSPEKIILYQSIFPTEKEIKEIKTFIMKIRPGIPVQISQIAETTNVKKETCMKVLQEITTNTRNAGEYLDLEGVFIKTEGTLQSFENKYARPKFDFTAGSVFIINQLMDHFDCTELEVIPRVKEKVSEKGLYVTRQGIFIHIQPLNFYCQVCLSEHQDTPEYVECVQCGRNLCWDHFLTLKGVSETLCPTCGAVLDFLPQTCNKCGVDYLNLSKKGDLCEFCGYQLSHPPDLVMKIKKSSLIGQKTHEVEDQFYQKKS